MLDRDDLELYDVEIAIDFYARLRGQVKYAGKEALIKQMHSMWSRRGICCMRPRPRQGERGRPKVLRTHEPARPRSPTLLLFVPSVLWSCVASASTTPTRSGASKARIELVELGELAVGRTVFEPGWRWSGTSSRSSTRPPGAPHRLRGVWASAYRDDRRRLAGDFRR